MPYSEDVCFVILMQSSLLSFRLICIVASMGEFNVCCAVNCWRKEVFHTAMLAATVILYLLAVFGFSQRSNRFLKLGSTTENLLFIYGAYAFTPLDAKE